MSWIIGFTGNKHSLKHTIKQLHSSPLFIKESEKFYLAAGGNSSTCFYSGNNPDKICAAVGVGLLCSEENYKLMHSDDWDSYFSNQFSRQNELYGHYVVLKLSGDTLEIQTDQIGLREIYLYQTDEFTIFSTRLDWIGKLTKSDFDISVLAGTWLLSSQLNNESLLKNTTRITKCRQCIVKNNSYKIILWESPFIKYFESTEKFHNTLDRLLTDLAKNTDTFELSLSGGLDSRLLLSFLIKNKINFNTHTFGNPAHPDNIIASQISKRLNFQHRNIYTPADKIDYLESKIEEFALIKRNSCPITEYLNLHYYDLFQPGNIIIDGGFGELWRNESLLKLKTTNKKDVMNKNNNALFKLLSVKRADIFSEDVINEMVMHAKNQVEYLFSKINSIGEIGINNFLDILLFNIKMPNYISPEQARIDHLAINLTPFVQPPLLKLFLGIDDEMKRNGKLFRKIIHQNCHELEKFKRVKGDVSFTFSSGSLKSRMVNRLKSRLGFSYIEQDKVRLLQLLKSYAFELLNSQSVKSYSLYDYNKIKSIVENYYRGDLNLSNQLSWWLSFEIFRSKINDG